jgi:hypothetical protein
MMCTSMPVLAASRETFRTTEPPPRSSWSRCLWLEPITIWVIWCEVRNRPRRIVGLQIRPLATHVVGKLAQPGQLLFIRTTGFGGANVDDMQIGLGPSGHP